MPQVELTEEEIHQIVALCDISKHHNLALWREGPGDTYRDDARQWKATRLKTAKFMQGLAEKLYAYLPEGKREI